MRDSDINPGDRQQDAVELLWQAVPPFPTRSGIWLKLLERREAELSRERAAKAAA